MSTPKPGDDVKAVLRNGEAVEGTIEWVDGNGAWVKNSQKSRWVPIEAFLQPTPPDEAKKGTLEE